MKVLVTGGTGFVGARVAAELAARGHHVVAYDSVLREIEVPSDSAGSVKTVWGDITDLANLFGTVDGEEVTGVIHLATIKSEHTCRQFPGLAFRVNVQGTQNVLEVARLRRLERVVMVSTGAVFGEWPDPAVSITEEARPCPKGMYANTKYAAERLVEAYSNVYGLNTAIVRISWVYGPGTRKPRLEFGTGPIPGLVQKALASKTVKEATGADFAANFSYVKDVARGIALAYLKTHTTHRLFHLGSGKNFTLVDVAQALMKAIPGTTITLGPGSGPYDQQAPIRGPLAIDRAREELGYTVEYSLDEGIRSLVEWVRASG